MQLLLSVILQRIDDNEYLNYRGLFIQARSESTGSLALGEFTFDSRLVT